MAADDQPWYAAWFDRAEYDIVYSRRDEADARRLLELVLGVTRLEPGAAILDMACGRGRHSKLLAHQGYRVTGIDLSPQAIEKAKESAEVESLDIEFAVGDMRDPYCSSCFDLVVNLFTSFGYFDDDAENQRAVSAMAEAVVDDGWLVQDFMNGDYWASNFVPEDSRLEDGLQIEQRRWLENGRLNKEIRLRDGSGQTNSFTESVRLFGLADFELMHRSAGMEVQHVFGDSDGTPLTAESKRLIVFSRKV